MDNTSNTQIGYINVSGHLCRRVVSCIASSYFDSMATNSRTWNTPSKLGSLKGGKREGGGINEGLEGKGSSVLYTLYNIIYSTFYTSTLLSTIPTCYHLLVACDQAVS